MVFRGVRIDGFGVWHDLDLSDLSPGVNVFLAPNEGGKSTLMAFIRAVLFGFKRRGDPHRYEPLRGGRHGGFIDFETSGTGYRVSRIDDGTSRGRGSELVASAPATLIVSIAQAITTHPKSRMACVGARVVLTIEAR